MSACCLPPRPLDRFCALPNRRRAAQRLVCDALNNASKGGLMLELLAIAVLTLLWMPLLLYP